MSRRGNKLPEGWFTGSMDDVVATIVAGTSVNCDDRIFEDGDKRVLKLSAVSGGRLRTKEFKVVAREEHSRLKTTLRAGTVLLTRKNTPQLVGDSAYVTDTAEVYLPDLIWELSPKEGIHPRWLNHWLQSAEFRKQVSRLCVGSSKSMVGISQEAFLDSPICIPPSVEQTRIVAVLEPWETAIDQVESAIAAIRNCYRGELEKIIALHTGESQRIDEICNVNILCLPAKTSPDFEFDYFDIASAEDNGEKDFSGHIAFRSAPSRARRMVADEGVVYATVRPLLRRLFVAKRRENAVYSTGYSILEPKECCLVGYLKHALLSRDVERQIFARLTGSGYPAINERDLGEVRIPLPNKNCQHKACETLDALEKQYLLYVKYSRALEIQKRGLMQRLLSGNRQLDARFDPPNLTADVPAPATVSAHIRKATC